MSGTSGPEIWRTGRHNRHIYRQNGDDPHDDDTWVGHMDTPELAAVVVTAVNAWHETQAVPSQEDR